MLRRVEGLELTEVASLAGCSLATAKRRIAEAEEIVRQHVGKYRSTRGGRVVSQLRYPLREGLRDPADEAALRRTWEAIDARFPRRRRRWTPAIGFASALALAGAIAVFVVVRHDPGPLRLADGQAVVAVEAPAFGARMSMSDGSSIQLSGGARLDPLESTGTSFVAFLEKGSADFEVHPGGPRKWRIECGLATVEVVGTRFSCERSPGQLRVAVTHGIVLVTGERVPDRVRRLAAGQSPGGGRRDVGPGPPPARRRRSRPPPATGRRPRGSSLRRSNRSARPVAPRPTPGASWPGAAGTRRPSPRSARRGSGAESRRLGIADSFALADVARLSGHPADAEAPLERILGEFASDGQASLAAFALGRLELDSLGRPRKAANALNRALALGIPQSLREDVRARLVEAYARAGDLAAARAAAETYTREFPGGRYTKTIESRLTGP